MLLVSMLVVLMIFVMVVVCANGRPDIESAYGPNNGYDRSGIRCATQLSVIFVSSFGIFSCDRSGRPRDEVERT